ncbi:MAG: DUF4340 domain-containing protein [Desulfobacteraceae bacterium]|nr:DUF4340 domain-containing protein [Desulfobacteraceae bacterium]
MKLRTFVILLVICGILGGAAYFMSGPDSQSDDKQLKMGENLLGQLPVEDIASITIKSSEDSVALKDKGTSANPDWVVENRFSYPANFSMIRDLVKKVKETKIGRSFKASDETLSNLSLHGPDKEGTQDDQKGIRITVEDNAKKVLADIIIGGTREASSGKGGHYVMLVKSPTIYLVDKNYRYVDKKPSEWLNKDLLKVDEKDVEKVVCFDSKTDKTVYTLKRPGKGSDPEFVDLPSDKKAKKANINKVVKAISSFKIEDISDPESAFENTLYFEYHLFDGTVYKIYPGNAQEQDDTKYLFKAEVSYSEPVKKEEADEAKPGEEPQKSPDELSTEAEDMNKKISPWVYVVPKWRYDNFITDPGEFYEDKEEPKPEVKPEEPEVRIEPEPVVEEEPESETEEPDVKKEEAEPETEEAESETEEPEAGEESSEAATEEEKEDSETEEVDADNEEAETEAEGEEADSEQGTEEAEETESEEAETESEE